jgi:hypothetical protein
MKGAERVEQEDKAEYDSDDPERLAFDEHAHDVINEVQDKSRDQE